MNINKKLVHIGKITFYASVFYLLFTVFSEMVFGTNGIVINLRYIGIWLLFNQPFPGIAGQYWFLFALLYAYIFYYILERLKLRKYAYILAAFLFLAYIVLAQGAHLAGYGIPNLIYRNWLIEAFPYFMLGHWIRENQERINISNKTLIVIIIITTLLCWVERWLMGRDFGVNIVTIPQVFALFVYGVKNPTRHEGIVQRLGRDCSMMVYILHPAVWHTFEGIYNKMGISENIAALYMMPIFVVGFSIFFSLLFNAIKAKVKIKEI